MSISKIIAILIILWIFIYTLSYALWVWKKKNKLGSIAVILLATTELMLPTYLMFIKA